jgi:hypothetical protein
MRDYRVARASGSRRRSLPPPPPLPSRSPRPNAFNPFSLFSSPLRAHACKVCARCVRACAHGPGRSEEKERRYASARVCTQRKEKGSTRSERERSWLGKESGEGGGGRTRAHTTQARKYAYTEARRIASVAPAKRGLELGNEASSGTSIS